MKPNYEHAGFVVSSAYRVEILNELVESPNTPSTIAERTGMAQDHLSRELNALRKRELIELLVDEDRKKGRIYGITESGEAVHELVSQMQGTVHA